MATVTSSSRTPLSLRFESGVLSVLDQRRVPHAVEYLTLRTPTDVHTAIRSMVVRGAPLIGIVAAYGVVLAASTNGASRAEVYSAIELLQTARPTAVNLRWALHRMQRAAEGVTNQRTLVGALTAEANAIMHEDRECNLAIARHGATLIPDNAAVLHHCNTGSLATSDYGTALGVIRYVHEQGRKIHAYLDETRPRLQGALLSAFELHHFGVPHTLIVDGASGFLMQRQKIDCCIVGCDRVALNGDTANKIGTLNLALAAKAHNVPFYVACPVSTIDFSLPSGGAIPIEERDPVEVRSVGGAQVTLPNTPVWNPAFDITPGSLVTAFITERGIIRQPFAEQLLGLREG